MMLSKHLIDISNTVQKENVLYTQPKKSDPKSTDTNINPPVLPSYTKQTNLNHTNLEISSMDLVNESNSFIQIYNYVLDQTECNSVMETTTVEANKTQYNDLTTNKEKTLVTASFTVPVEDEKIVNTKSELKINSFNSFFIKSDHS